MLTVCLSRQADVAICSSYVLDLVPTQNRGINLPPSKGANRNDQPQNATEKQMIVIDWNESLSSFPPKFLQKEK